MLLKRNHQECNEVFLQAFVEWFWYSRCSFFKVHVLWLRIPRRRASPCVEAFASDIGHLAGKRAWPLGPQPHPQGRAIFDHLTARGVSSTPMNGFSGSLELRPERVAGPPQGAGVQICDKGTPVSPPREQKWRNDAVFSSSPRLCLGALSRIWTPSD